MSFDISNFVNRGSVRWIVVAVFLVGTFGATGIAAAELDGTETEFYNETTPITDDTTDLEVTVNGTNGSDVFVNYYRVANDSNSTETLETEDMILSSPTGVEANTTYPVQINDTAAYRVVVHDNGDGLNASEVGEITVTPMAASGGFFGGDSGNAPIIGIIAVVALALVVRMRE
jgi:hypothetical protein